MKKILKPVAFLVKLRVFCVFISLLASCQSPAPRNRQPVKPEPTPAETPNQKRESITSKGKLSPTTEQAYLGLSKATALSKAKEAKLKARIVKEDGKLFMVTKDYRPDRLNFTIESGKVTRVTKG